MTPRKFFEDVVVPNLSECDAAPSDIRIAFNSLASVDALAAHIFVWREANIAGGVSGDDSQYRNDLAIRSTDFRIVRDAAKAQKHVKLTRYKPEVSSASQIAPRSVGWGEAGYGDGPWGGGTVVAIEFNNGSVAIVGATLHRAVAFQTKEMTDLGI